MGNSFCTYKYVQIYDRTLGLLYIGSYVLVSIYLLIDVVLLKGYLDMDGITGTLRVKPKRYHYTQQQPDASPPFCMPPAACEHHWDEYDMTDVGSHDSSIFVTTFVKDTREGRNETDDDYTELSERMFFVAGVDDLVLKIEHSFHTDRHDEGYSQRAMKGRAPFHPFVLDESGPDKVTVRDLVSACGVSLDGASDAHNAKNQTVRQRGVVLLVRITYANTGLFGVLAQPTYRYDCAHIAHSDYHVAQRLSSTNGNGNTTHTHSHPHTHTRHLRKRYGLRVVCSQSGRIGYVSSRAVVLRIVSGVGLFTLAAWMVELLAFYVLPKRGEFTRCMVEETRPSPTGGREKAE
mmetsp:Transcript_43408/g.108434  ORF Transcript_43408/g.108434 Transcript_43408/m.108434 type:complete len:348 (-) Transcript_43408:185-1228(-)